MSLNGIDISSWQKGINLNVVPGDFVIVKATQGTTYVNSDYERSYAQGAQAGKCMGIYHYATGVGAIAEADFFLSKVGSRVGKAILVLDWEQYQNTAWKGGKNVAYVKQFLDRIYEKTGVRGVLYMSQSVTNVCDWSSVSKNYGLWVAQYADMNPTGYQTNPWSKKVYGSWGSSCLIHQYSSCGQLAGYKNLDMDIAYIDRNDWARLASKEGQAVSQPAVSTPVVNVPSGSTLDLVYAVMLGKYGNGDARKQVLGSRYSEVQTFIEHIFSASISTLAEETKNGKYGNGDVRKTVLSSRYNEVQKAIDGTPAAPKKTAQLFEKGHERGKIFYTTDALNIRKDAGDGSIITCLSVNTKCMWYGYYKQIGNVRWYYVLANGIVGYVSGDYLR